MHALYLKSIKSPVRAPGRFKLKYDHNADINVFSQKPNTEEYSEYLEDSFCVNSDYDESEYIDDDGNDTLMMMPPPKTKKRPKERSKPAATAKGRSRIVKTAESSSDDEADVTNRMNRTELNRSKVHESKNNGNRNRIKSSSTSASDESLLRKGDKGAHKIKSSTSSTGDEPDSPVVTGLTQMAPLRERLRQRLELEASVSEQERSEKTRQTSAQFTLLKPVETQKVQQNWSTGKRDTHKENIKSAFSLTIEGFSDSDDEDFNISEGNITKVNQTVKSFTSGTADSSRHNVLSSNAKDQPKMPSVAQRDCLPKKTSPQEISREERIRLAKLKQEGFRKKLLAQHNTNISSSSVQGATPSSVRNVQKACLPTYATPPVNSHKHNKPIILVDSKEISSSQDVLSTLRFKHQMNAQIRSLGTCDYIVSNRMAVERKSMSDFTNGQNKGKLVQRIRTMLETFDRVAIIIERDREKGKGADNKSTSCVSVMKSKYVEQTISWLGQVPNIKIFYTENQIETAAILHELNSQEQRKGSSIQVPIELSQEKEQMLRFYMSLPRMSYILGLNFLHAFSNLKHFIHCPTTSIMKRFQLTKSRVEDMKAHFTRTFDQQMIPVSNR